MRKILSLSLVLFLTFTFIGCRANITQESLYSSSNSNNQITVCHHQNTLFANQVEATCTSNGYTGDTVCADCNVITAVGTLILATGHDTEIRNRQEATTAAPGYTGDTYCKICNTLTASGKIIPQLQETAPNNKVKYTTDNGYVYVIDKGVDITEFSMKHKTQYITHKYHNIELEIFNLCNAEREKLGLSPLVWCEEAYYFTNIRAEEIYSKWDHQRPDGTDWHTVYTNADVILQSCAENLAQQQGGRNIAAGVVEAWMNSTAGHRESILNPNFTKVAIAVTYIENDYTICVAQHFFN